jgi:hypothetical protein
MRTEVKYTELNNLLSDDYYKYWYISTKLHDDTSQKTEMSTQIKLICFKGTFI